MSYCDLDLIESDTCITCKETIKSEFQRASAQILSNRFEELPELFWIDPDRLLEITEIDKYYYLSNDEYDPETFAEEVFKDFNTNMTFYFDKDVREK